MHVHGQNKKKSPGNGVRDRKRKGAEGAAWATVSVVEGNMGK